MLRAQPNSLVVRLRPVVAGLFFLLACTGDAIALWTHVVSLLTKDPRDYFELTWIVQLVLLVLLLPILVEVLRRGLEGVRLFPAPRWQKRMLVVLIVYYTFHFYIFIWAASDHVESYMTWRMYSAGWLLLFTLCAVYYRARARTTY